MTTIIMPTTTLKEGLQALLEESTQAYNALVNTPLDPATMPEDQRVTCQATQDALGQVLELFWSLADMPKSAVTRQAVATSIQEAGERLKMQAQYYLTYDTTMRRLLERIWQITLSTTREEA